MIESLDGPSRRDLVAGGVAVPTLGPLAALAKAMGPDRVDPLRVRHARHRPCAAWLRELSVANDDKSFVLTGTGLLKRSTWSSVRPPFFLETPSPGIFAIGEVRSGSIKRVA